MDPLLILPEEMWDCIIKKLDRHEDLLTVSNTCQLWRSFVEKSQTEWMFQGVLPLVQKYLPKSDLLNCRTVCKSWKKEVDSYMETEQPSINAPGGPYKPNCTTPPRTLQVNLDASAQRRGISTTEALKCFLNEFSSAKGVPCAQNPFISRSLEVTISEMNTTVVQFFEKFGVHLHSLHLSIFQENPSEITPPIKIAEFIWCILGLVPNLKKLVLLTMQDPDAFPEMSKEEEEAQNQEVEQFLENNLAPRLPQLKNLHLDVNVHMINQVLESSYAPQLTKYVHLTTQEFVPSNLTNVKELDWHFVSGYPLVELNKLKNLDVPSLEHLQIYVTKFGGREDTNHLTDELFKSMECIGSSLTRLSIYWRYFEPNFPAQLNLPLVQEVCLEIGRCLHPERINLSFLQDLKSLRKLKCIFCKSINAPLLKTAGGEDHPSTIDTVDLHYYLMEDKQVGPYQSNIWRLLPSLENI